MNTKMLQLVGRVAGAILFAAGLTFVCYRVFPVNSTTAALLYMLLILAVSAGCGQAEGLVTAVVSSAALSYFFLPPIGFSIRDRGDVVAMFVFLVVALVTSQLSTRLRNQAREAIRRREETERLYAISRSFMLMQDGSAIPAAIVRHLTQTFGFSGVALFCLANNQVYRGGLTEVPVSDVQLRGLAKSHLVNRELPSGVYSIPLAQEGNVVGTLAVIGGTPSATALHAISNLTAITLLRNRSNEASSQSLLV
jgi:two-component system, OmpR family, sensor histidine kinase KdpD